MERSHMNLSISVSPGTDILFHGFKPLTKCCCHLEIVIAYHRKQRYFEIVAYHPQLDVLAPRAYLDYDTLITALDLEPQMITKKENAMKFLFDHLDIYLEKYRETASFSLLFVENNEVLDIFSEKPLLVFAIEIDIFSKSKNFQDNTEVYSKEASSSHSSEDCDNSKAFDENNYNSVEIFRKQLEDDLQSKQEEKMSIFEKTKKKKSPRNFISSFSHTNIKDSLQKISPTFKHSKNYGVVLPPIQSSETKDLAECKKSPRLFGMGSDFSFSLPKISPRLSPISPSTSISITPFSNSSSSNSPQENCNLTNNLSPLPSVTSTIFHNFVPSSEEKLS